MKKKSILLVLSVIIVAAAAITVTLFMKRADTASLDLLEKELQITDVSASEDTGKENSGANTILTFYLEAQEPKVEKEVLDHVANKTLKALNTTIDFEYVWQPSEAYLTKIRQVIAAGSPCDAFYFSSYFPVPLKSLVADGTALDITELFPDYAPKYYSRFAPEELKAASVKDKVYAVPHRWPSTARRCAIVREDLMSKYNIPEIRSYEDYDVYLRTIKANEPDMFPMSFYETAIGLFAEANGYVILDYALGIVYKWDDPEMKLEVWEQTPAFRKGLDTIRHWTESGYMLKGAEVGEIDETKIASGKWASLISTQGSELEYNALVRGRGKDFTYKAYPLYPDKVSERSSPMGGTFVLSAKSKNADLVLSFIEWLQSEQENYDSLMYGVMDKHYQLKGDLIQLPAGVKPQESCYTWPWHWPFQNIDNERGEASSAPDAVAKYRESIEQSTKYPPHMGFVPDVEAVIDVVTLRRTSFYSTEQKIYTGTLSEKDIETYIDEQKQYGVGKMIAHVQKQLDEWKAENGN